LNQETTRKVLIFRVFHIHFLPHIFTQLGITFLLFRGFSCLFAGKIVQKKTEAGLYQLPFQVKGEKL
jgi:hypothetical protein